MRIAYVINSVEGGGAANPVPAVTRVLRDSGAEVMVLALTRRDGRALPAMRASGVEVAVRDGGERDHAAALRWLDQRVAAYRPTHLWTSLTRATLLGQLVGRWRRLPVVSWQHSAVLKPANLTLLRATQGMTTLWIGDSATVTSLTAERLGVPRGRLATWPIFAADPMAPRARPWLPGETVRVGSLGRLHPVKGYDVLIDACARLAALALSTPFEVLIAGDGEERQRLEARAVAAGLSGIRFVGYAERPAEFLARLHVYVQPSRHEGFCVAVHEAMAAGLPIVASEVGELPRSVASDSGVLVPPGDAAALAEALAGMLAEPRRLAAIGRASRVRVLTRYSKAGFEAAGREVLERLRASRPSLQESGEELS